MASSPDSSDFLPAALNRDQLATAIGLAGIAALAWGYIIHMGRMSSSTAAMAMPMPGEPAAPGLEMLVPMWIVMMVAMMVPAATPTILLFASVARRRRVQGLAAASTAVFTLGYLLVWTGYATVAAVAQWKLHRLSLLSPAMSSARPWLGGGLLILAGIYQWLPVKNACLSHCRSPLGFLGAEWREGNRGALLMGFRHGSFCVGCCALLMTLLFVAGVMNLLWVAALAILVLAERLVSRGRSLSRVTGLVLISWGVWVIAAAF